MSTLLRQLKGESQRYTNMDSHGLGKLLYSAAERIAELESNILMLEQYNGSVESLIKDIKAHNLEQQNKFIDILYKAGKCDADCLEYFKALKEQE
jgi:hypothetical protein